MTSLKFSSSPNVRAALSSLAICGLLLASGCAPVPSRPPSAANEAAQSTREAQLQARRDWGFRGRVALSQGDNGGNAGIRWRQRGGDFDIELSAPVTRQSWRLRSHGAQVSLEGLEGGIRSGTDAEALLLEATGWRIPVTAMSAWARGMRAPGPAEMASDPQGLPAELLQQGWKIEYRGWFPSEPPMPQKVFARQDKASVRLVVDAWDPP